MAISEDLATDIDIVIAMWCQQRRVVGISWDDRCALRKLIYDLFVDALATPHNSAMVPCPRHQRQTINAGCILSWECGSRPCMVQRHQ